MRDKVLEALEECDAGMAPPMALSHVRRMIQHASNNHETEHLNYLRKLRDDLKAGSISQTVFEMRLKSFLLGLH
jgi:hypothetical protein